MGKMSVITGVTYSLVIGIEFYNQQKTFDRVIFATKDAKEFESALSNLGVNSDTIKLLLDKDATFTTIKTELKQICRKATKDDRIIFFFAGHGVYVEEENWIVPVDAYITNLKDTCISISSILGHLKKSFSKRNILFLDCCHSGFEPGEIVRDIGTDFLADELLYNFRDEEYCCGFASSKSDQKSISSPILQNGVWTHFLIKALKGDGGRIYDHGILFHDKLQSYLKKNVSEFVRVSSTSKHDQIPTWFGNFTDKFPIADLNLIFDQREKAKMGTSISFRNISLLSEENGDVKSLPGFQKGFHKIPTSVYSGANAFIKSCGAKIVSDEIDELSESVRQNIKYKRGEIEAWSVDGTGAISTPDFTYSMEIFQSDDDPTEYVLLRKLESFSKSNLIMDKKFNSIFSSHFERLELELSNKIDINDLIDIIEGIDDEDIIALDYNPTDTAHCTISIPGAKHKIHVSQKSIGIQFGYKTNPINLITAYKETQHALLGIPEIKLLT